MIGLVATVVLFPLAGLAFARLLGRAPLFLAGAGSVGSLLFVAGVLHIPIRAALIAIAVASLATVIATKRHRRPVVMPPIALPIVAAVLLFIAAVVPLADYDGRAFWIPKAKAIAVENAIDGPFFHGQRGDSARNHYPLLLPLDGAAVMMVARDVDDRQVRWLYALIAIALAFEAARRFGACVGIVILALPRIAIAPDGALSAYADIAVGAFAACALFELLDAESPARFGMWLAFLALTKNEGLPFAVVLLAAGAVVFRRRIVAALLPPVVAITALLVWRTRIPRNVEEDFAKLIWHTGEHVDRFFASLRILIVEGATLANWGLFWIAALAAAIVLAVRREWRPIALASACVVPMIILYAAVYAVAPWPMDVLSGNLAARLLTHVSGAALILFGAALRSSRSVRPHEIDEAAVHVD